MRLLLKVREDTLEITFVILSDYGELIDPDNIMWSFAVLEKYDVIDTAKGGSGLWQIQILKELVAGR